MQISRYITPLVALVALFVLSCTSSIDEGGETVESGSISINLEVTRSSDDEQDDNELLESGTLRIYNSDGGLVRYYKDLSKGVVDFLAKGSYSAAFAVGTETPATFDSADISYSGETDFVVSSQKTSVVEMEVIMDNTVLTITFNPTLDSHYADYSFVAYAANNADETKLTFTANTDASTDGYLILPDGEDDIEWEFWGKEITYLADGSTTTAEDAVMITSNTIEGAKRAYQYKLTLKYSDYLDVSGWEITLDGTEDYDDIFGFKPQPVIKGSEFDIDKVQYYAGEGYELSVNTLFEITDVTVAVDGSSYVCGVDSEVTYNSETKTITLSSSIFETILASHGGVSVVTVDVTDVNGSVGSVDMSVGITGFMGISNEDFWARTVTMSGYTATEYSTGDVQIRYRVNGTGDTGWITNDATYVDGHEWSVVSNDIVWSSATDSNNTSGASYWSFTGGYTPSTNYDYQMIVDGQEQDIIPITSAAATQSIPTLSDSGLSCYTTSNKSAIFWGSGNNSTISDLCNYDSSTSSAYLEAQSMVAFAAGNVFSGVFSQSGYTGTVDFGQVYSWQIRPKSISVNYQATVGSDDKGLIYLAIVDWPSRHVVESTYSLFGSNTTTGAWSPASQTSTDKGKIIGYALTYLTASQSSFTTLELPIYYYDTDAVPTSGNYSIVIMATTSYRGEYFEGSTSSRLYVKDFEFGY